MLGQAYSGSVHIPHALIGSIGTVVLLAVLYFVVIRKKK
jgi:hypothetical protein